MHWQRSCSVCDERVVGFMIFKRDKWDDGDHAFIDEVVVPEPFPSSQDFQPERLEATVEPFINQVDVTPFEK